MAADSLFKRMELRPHHGMCIGQFMGHGYSNEFVANMKQVIERLEEAADDTVTLVCHPDIICACCVYKNEDACHSGQKVLDYDTACLDICGLEENQQITWKEFKERVKKEIILKDKLKEVCVDCTWLTICEEHAGLNY